MIVVVLLLLVVVVVMLLLCLVVLLLVMVRLLLMVGVKLLFVCLFGVFIVSVGDDVGGSVIIVVYSVKVGRKTLRNRPNQVPDLIQDISWKKRTAQRKINKDITSDSQVNSYFPYRWSPASQTFNIYFYLFLYLYITRITINNDTPHLKSPKN